MFKGDIGEIKRENEFDEVAMAFWVFKINVYDMVLIYGDIYEEIRWENHFGFSFCGGHVFGSRERRRGV